MLLEISSITIFMQPLKWGSATISLSLSPYRCRTAEQEQLTRKWNKKGPFSIKNKMVLESLKFVWSDLNLRGLWCLHSIATHFMTAWTEFQMALCCLKSVNKLNKGLFMAALHSKTESTDLICWPYPIFVPSVCNH